MIKCNYIVGEPFVEAVIDELEQVFIMSALREGKTPIVDATHCKPSAIMKYEPYLPEGCKISVVMLECPLWKQKIRNVYRYIRTGMWVPVGVIKGFNKGYVKMRKWLEVYQNHEWEVIYYGNNT